MQLEQALQHGIFSENEFLDWKANVNGLLKKSKEGLIELEHLMRYDSSSKRTISRTKLRRLQDIERAARRDIERTIQRELEKQREKKKRMELVDPKRVRIRGQMD